MTTSQQASALCIPAAARALVARGH